MCIAEEISRRSILASERQEAWSIPTSCARCAKPRAPLVVTPHTPSRRRPAWLLGAFSMWCKALALIHIRWWSPCSKDTRGAYENSPQIRSTHLNLSVQLAGLDALTPLLEGDQGGVGRGGVRGFVSLFEDSCQGCSRFDVNYHSSLKIHLFQRGLHDSDPFSHSHKLPAQHVLQVAK